ncbi:MAG: hypothetical protein ABSA44_10905 [Bacteroidota bacterium]
MNSDGVPGDYSSYQWVTIPPQPVISSISPSSNVFSGAPNSPTGITGGQLVTIQGANFGINTGTVSFFYQGKPIENPTSNYTFIPATTDGMVWNNSTIQCYVPKGACSGPVVVTTAEPDNVSSDQTQSTAQFDISFGYNGWVWTWPQASTATSVLYYLDPKSYQFSSSTTLQSYIDAAASTWTTAGSKFGFNSNPAACSTSTLTVGWDNDIFFGTPNDPNVQQRHMSNKMEVAIYKKSILFYFQENTF